MNVHARVAERTITEAQEFVGAVEDHLRREGH